MTCSASHKKVYTFGGDASLAAQTVEAIFGDVVHPYVGRSCGGFHLGHSSVLQIILRWDQIRSEVAVLRAAA